ncbi:hypothetical protein QKP79_gp3 [Aucuba ringspot virus]|uniref:RNA-directed DNA polymerase n=1 Tax=Aucuba ringspot virus TaxID=2599303 RepID=A0AAD1GH94_9VIRU|nr:hypothetical protein QKP79_gp3 [Aucuba ringspot virus]BBL52464.1 unnamed protein product [Aucuba ringspot virus]
MTTRTETVQQLPPATQRSTSPTETLDDQIRGYRRWQRARHLANNRLRRLTSRTFRTTLEQQLNPDQELSLSRRRRANLVPAEVLYSYNTNEPVNRVYQHYEEVRQHVVDRQLDLRFIEESSYQALQNEGMQHIHLGMMMLRVQILHRVDSGIQAMVVFRDTRWTDDRQILSAMTMDLARGTQMVYTIPNLLLSIHDFFNHVQVSVITRGYNGGWTGGESNLIITRALIGRITNTSQANFNYNVEGVSDFLTSQGVQAIPGQPWQQINNERSWQLAPSTITAPLSIPTRIISRQKEGGNLSIRFLDHQDQPAIPDPEPEDEERERGQPDTHYALVLNFSDPYENWDTLGEPSGKYDYMVKYSRPDWTRQREIPIVATGWDLDSDSRPAIAAVNTVASTSSSATTEEILELYPKRQPRTQVKPKQVWTPKAVQTIGTSSDLLFGDLGLKSKNSLVNSWLKQLDSDTEKPPMYDTSSSDEASSCKTEDESPRRIGSDTYSAHPVHPASQAATEAEYQCSNTYAKSERAYAGKLEELGYPTKIQNILQKLKAESTEIALPGESSRVKMEDQFIPTQEHTGPIHYLPADQTNPPFQMNTSNNLSGFIKPGRHGRPMAPWMLPTAYQRQGALLVLPPEVTSHADAITTWETVTLNLLRDLTFDSLQEKVDYIENLLGPRERETFVTWRMQYAEEYRTMVSVADEPRNVTSAIKRVMGFSDPFTGNLHQQNKAYADLERLQCPNMESIMPFLYAYFQLAAQSGRMWVGAELSDKIFRKLPPEIGPTIEKEYKERYPGMHIGVNARIQFIAEYLQNLCKQADLQRKLKNLNFCRSIPIPGYYETSSGKRKYGIRKAKNYQGKPHSTHVKVIKNKSKPAAIIEGKKCKCYLCGLEGHFARECPKKSVRPERAAFFEGLNLDQHWDIISVDMNENDSDAICSISEGEARDMEELETFKYQLPYHVDAQYDPFRAYAVITLDEIPEKAQNRATWRVVLELKEDQKKCIHHWDDMFILTNQSCSSCRDTTTIGRRATCTICLLNLCGLCASLDYGLRIIPQAESKRQWQYQNRDQLIQSLYDHNAFLVKKVEALSLELDNSQKALGRQRKAFLIDLDDQMEKNFSDEKFFFQGGEGATHFSNSSTSAHPISKLKAETEKSVHPAHLTEIEAEKEFEAFHQAQFSSPLTYPNTIPLGQRHDQKLKGIAEESETSLMATSHELDEEIEDLRVYPEMPKGGNNKLYHVLVSFRIPHPEGKDSIDFEVNAIVDTGCTCCCINSAKVPEPAQEDAKITQRVAGINSTTVVTKRLRNGKMILAGQEFYTPYISVFPMGLANIDMLIGCNFIRAMKGGLRFEGTEITFYKTVTRIQTTLEPQKIAYLEELIEQEDLKLEAYNLQEDGIIKLRNLQLLQDLKDQGFIGDDPLKHWSKNGVHCKLEIINPDITIEDKPPGHLTVEEKARYQAHINILLDLGVIRPSKSRHRTAAFIVKSGTTIDPETGKEKKGKERMVFNYKMLNDNTHKDQYSLPGINSIIKAIGNAKVFSKFDLKSGFHQVAMEESSIPWTAFITPDGLYEWLVMPFGLKNAPAVFQRKMDNCFRGTEDFIAVYIDDILVFSENLQEHEEHLKIMLEICRKNGLVLSPTKMKIACSEIEFLGAVIKRGKIKLQEHIIKRIAQVDDDSLKTLKGLRSWLGVINYARAYIPRCGVLLGPLYSKTSEHGDRRWRTADWKIVREIKALVQDLPDLEIPPGHAYIIIESDGCMEGWGGICKWKEAKAAPRGNEKVCAYASGKFPVVKSTIDAEIHAVMNALEQFKLFYMDKEELTVRIDCQAIISFYEKMAVKKPSRVRWISFCDYITNTGIQVKFEHIKGSDNQLADQLSRLAQQIMTAQFVSDTAHEALVILREGDYKSLDLITGLNKAILNVQAQSKKLQKSKTTSHEATQALRSGTQQTHAMTHDGQGQWCLTAVTRNERQKEEKDRALSALVPRKQRTLRVVQDEGVGRTDVEKLYSSLDRYNFWHLGVTRNGTCMVDSPLRKDDRDFVVPDSSPKKSDQMAPVVPDSLQVHTVSAAHEDDRYLALPMVPPAPKYYKRRDSMTKPSHHPHQLHSSKTMAAPSTPGRTEGSSSAEKGRLFLQKGSVLLEDIPQGIHEVPKHVPYQSRPDEEFILNNQYRQLIQNYRLKDSRTLEEMNTLSKNLRKIEEEAEEELLHQIEQYGRILFHKRMYTQMNSSSDNYWGDWHPHTKEVCAQHLKVTKELYDLIKKNGRFHT